MAGIGSALDVFRSRFGGDVLVPEDEAYEDVRVLWNGAFDKRPAVIARCRDTDDIVDVIRFADESGLPLAVRGGGHSLAGLSSCDDGIMLDLSLMRYVLVDPDTRTAIAQPGATRADFDAATQAHGLASTGGLISHTGVAGLTLGGGIGWLMRKHGLAADNLSAAEVVTADGSIVRASSSDEPELLWGLARRRRQLRRGVELRVPSSSGRPIVLGGLMAFPLERGHEVLKAYRSWAAELPDEFTTMAAVVTAPPAPFVPAELVGQRIVAIPGSWCGDIEAGLAALSAMRELKPPIDAFGPMPYTALQGMLDEGAPHGIHAYTRSGYAADLSDGLIEAVIEHGARMTTPFSQIHFHQMGGAVERVGEDDTAFGNRRAAFAFTINAMWMEPGEDDRHEAANRDAFEAFAPYSTGGVYVNFLGNEGAARIRAAYSGAKFERLTRLKRTYDPQNLFRLNQNVEPAA